MPGQPRLAGCPAARPCPAPPRRDFPPGGDTRPSRSRPRAVPREPPEPRRPRPPGPRGEAARTQSSPAASPCHWPLGRPSRWLTLAAIPWTSVSSNRSVAGVTGTSIFLVPEPGQATHSGAQQAPGAGFSSASHMAPIAYSPAQFFSVQPPRENIVPLRIQGGCFDSSEICHLCPDVPHGKRSGRFHATSANRSWCMDCQGWLRLIVRMLILRPLSA